MKQGVNVGIRIRDIGPHPGFEKQYEHERQIEIAIQREQQRKARSEYFWAWLKLHVRSGE